MDRGLPIESEYILINFKSSVQALSKISSHSFTARPALSKSYFVQLFYLVRSRCSAPASPIDLPLRHWKRLAWSAVAGVATASWRSLGHMGVKLAKALGARGGDDHQLAGQGQGCGPARRR